MNIEKRYITNHRCFKAGQKIKVQGFMLHSVGTPQPDPLVFARSWNSSAAEACTQAIIGTDGVVIQTLPWDYKAWHCKLSGNSTHIGVEMTEPATITYTRGANFIDNNPVKTKAHVMDTYRTAVELFAFLCSMYRYDPLAPRVILSHSEGNALGIASPHADVEHLWKRFGLTMDKFRRDVKVAMEGELDVLGLVKVTYGGADGVNVRKLPMFGNNVVGVAKKGEVFTVVGVEGEFLKLKSGLYITSNKFYVDFNEGAGFKPYTVRINVPTLNIRSEPKLASDDLGDVYQGEVFTIVDEQLGWGKLKSGAGWIFLKHTVKA